MKSSVETTQILREIFKNPRVSQREIAFKNRISLGKVNYALQSLIEKGYIKIHNFTGSKNKRKYMYVLTPSGMYEKAKLTSVFLKWKMEEYERIKKEIEELKADINSPGRDGMRSEQLDGDSLFSGEKI
jgi:EPS-associated MarR family transcriptional regulator